MLMYCFLFPSMLLANGLHIKTLPWLTIDSIEIIEGFLKEHDDAKVLEFGCGGSTVWFAKRTNNLTTVEHDKNWFYFINNALIEDEFCNSVNFILHSRPYVSVVNDFAKEYFDLVLVDGRERPQCAKEVIPYIKSGGMLILDDFERGEYNSILHLFENWHCINTITNYYGDVDRNYGKITRIYIKP